MKKEQKHTTERILNLTLEIIYLLTGEDYGPVKQPADHITTSNCSGVSERSQRTIMDPPPPPSLGPDINHDKKILEVTQKIVELMTGEVPIRCQDVSVYFSMEEWEYLGGHRDLYKDVMMENRPPLTSPGDLHGKEVTEEVHLKKEPLPTEEHPTQPNFSTPTHHTQPSSAHTKEVPFEEHLPHSNSSASQKVSCDRRERSSRSRQCLTENSITAEVPSDDKPYGCCGCGKSFETDAELIKHRKIHTGQKPYSCSECGKCFLYNSQLVTHQRIHTGERPFACSECGKSFIKNAHLVTHQRSHTGEKPFSCPECGKCFVNNTILQAHLRVHIGDMPFDCAECGKSFVSKSSLSKHQKYHSREKPFSCSECGKAFLKNSDLNRHLRIHTGERPYCCSTCDKRFIQKSSLVLHQRTHTGQRPYSCAQCGRGFHFKTSLVKHESKHTEKRLPSPDTTLSSGGPVLKK